MHEEILHFWFEDIQPAQWWKVEADFDAWLRQHYGTLLESAARGECHGWRGSAHGRLAEIIVLDQFSRNIFRGTPRAFAQDGMALVLAQEAVTGGALDELGPAERAFLLMPYMHSESRLIHVEAERLFGRWAPQDSHDFELRHKAIIDRFGRYPHRNAILGRESGAEEIEFLQQPGSSF